VFLMCSLLWLTVFLVVRKSTTKKITSSFVALVNKARQNLLREKKLVKKNCNQNVQKRRETTYFCQAFHTLLASPLGNREKLGENSLEKNNLRKSFIIVKK